MELHEYADEIFDEKFGASLSQQAHAQLERHARDYGEAEVFTAIDIAVDRYEDPLDAFTKIGGILSNRATLRGRYFKKRGE